MKNTFVSLHFLEENIMVTTVSVTFGPFKQTVFEAPTPDFMDRLVKFWDVIKYYTKKDINTNISITNDGVVWYEGNVLDVIDPFYQFSLLMSNEKENIITYGTSRSDVLVSQNGINETIVGGLGFDVIFGSTGDDGYRGSFDKNVFVTDRLDELVAFGSETPGEIWTYYNNSDYQTLYDICYVYSLPDKVLYDISGLFIPVDNEEFLTDIYPEVIDSEPFDVSSVEHNNIITDIIASSTDIVVL